MLSGAQSPLHVGVPHSSHSSQLLTRAGRPASRYVRMHIIAPGAKSGPSQPSPGASSGASQPAGPQPAAPPPVYDPVSDPEADNPVTQKELKGLASRVEQGFYSVDVRFQQVDVRFQQLDDRLQQLLQSSAGAPQWLAYVMALGAIIGGLAAMPMSLAFLQKGPF